ncbi:MAG: UDP-glucose/GDP-mannose dehydrogenase family protein [Deltaproteobacteria bacterium]|nr:UDP-glucose/GDP-mannose dehydrogenase family protein [Deltaproteobacteria bacterium]
MRMAVVGTGYVGLVAGAGFANLGNTVRGVDRDAAKIEALQAGRIPIFEPGLGELVARNVAAHRLSFSTDVEAAVRDSEVVLIAVGTPSGPDGRADLSAVMAVADLVGAAIRAYTVVLIKSTVPVGTNDRVTERIAGRTKVDFDVVSNPEFLKEGAAVADFMKPDRVVIGARSERALELVRRLYLPLMRTAERILVMDPRSAELTKYVANSYLATRISFINEIANLCERVGADASAVRAGAGSDSRIGLRYFFPGCGYGGSCFPKDVRELLGTAEQYGLPLQILGAVHRVNEGQKALLARKVTARFGADLHGKRFAVWGLAFKPETDDMREAPSLAVVAALVGAGAEVRAHDPVARECARAQLPASVRLVDDEYEAARGADGLVVCTEWQGYRTPDFARLRGEMRLPVIFDGRNVYAKCGLAELGFEYYGIGVGKALPA